MDEESSAAISVTPYAARGAVMLTCGFVCDKLMQHGVPTIHIRKFMNSLSLLGPAVCFVVLAAVRVSEGTAVALLVVGVGLSGTANMGVNLAVIDMFPEVRPSVPMTAYNS